MPTITLRPTSDQYAPYAGTGITNVVGGATLAAALGDSSDGSYVRLNNLSNGAQPPPAGTITNRGALFIVGMTTATIPTNAIIRSVTVRARAARLPVSGQGFQPDPELFVGFADNSRVAEGPPFPQQDNYSGNFAATPVDVIISNTALVTFVGNPRAASPNTLGPIQNQPSTGGYYSGGAWTQQDIDNLNLAVAYDAKFPVMSTMGQVWTPQPLDVYELYADVLYATIPSVTMQAPVGTITTENNPVVRWTFIAGQDGGPQVYYRVKIFSQAQYQAAGFDPWLSLSTWDSTTTNSPANSVRSGALLANGTYRAFAFVAAVTNGQTQWAVSSVTGPYSEFVINVPGPGAPTISAVASNTFGRVAVNVTKGANPVWAYAQVQRSADGGVTWVDVRDYTLADMAGITTFTVNDYEAPPDTSVRYRARGLSLSGGGTAIGTWSSNSNAVSWTISFSTTTCDGSAAWLKNPLNANQNTIIRLGAGALSVKERKITRGMFPVLGRVNPLAVTDVRTSIETTLMIITKTVAEENAILALFGAATTLLLQAPSVFGWASAYISPGDLTESQVIPNISRAERLFSVPVVVTDAPAGVSVPVVAAPPPPPVTPPGSQFAFATSAVAAGAANNPSVTVSGGGGASAYPTAATTGVVNPALLNGVGVNALVWRTASDGTAISTTEVIGGNTYRVFTYKNFVGTTGYVYLDSPYVKFVNCQFGWTGLVNNGMAMVQQSSASLAVIWEDCTFDGGAAFHNRGINGDYGHFTVLRGNFTRCGEAAVEKNNRTGQFDFTVTDSYITEVKGWPSAAHVDGLQVDGARHVTIQHNTIWIEPFNATNGDTTNVSNSCIGVWATLAHVAGNVLIDNNQLAGGGTVIYAEQQSFAFQGTFVISNNRFDRPHFPSLQGAAYNPSTGHAAIWYVLYPGGLPASLSGAAPGWTGNKWEDGTAVTVAGGSGAPPGGGTDPGRPDIANAPAAADLILWLGIDAIDELTDAQFIDLRDNWGITTIACQFSYLWTFGGSQRKTNDTSATFNATDGRTGTEWAHMRKIKYGNAGVGTTGLGNIVNRLHALGMKIYGTTRWRNLNNHATVLVEWFDNAGWTTFLDAAGPLAEHIGYCEAWGFDGIGFDDEILGGSPPDPSWKYVYTGNTSNEQTTRAKVFQRGAEIGALFASIWPDMDIVEYNTTGQGGFPDDWDEDFAQAAAGRGVDIKETSMQRDLWDGVFSATAYTGTLRFLSSTFYRGVGSGATWFGAEQYNAVRQLARISRTWASWNLAHDRFFVNPMHWPGRAANLGGGEDFPMSLATIQASFAASRILGMGHITFYTQTITNDNAYFTSAMKDVFRAARVQATVNTVVPTLSAITQSGRSGNNINLAGSAAHPLGIRYIEWEVFNSAGTVVESTGAFGHSFVPGATGNHQSATGYASATYTFTGIIAAPAGRKVRITAVSIKDQAHSTQITV